MSIGIQTHPSNEMTVLAHLPHVISALVAFQATGQAGCELPEAGICLNTGLQMINRYRADDFSSLGPHEGNIYQHNFDRKTSDSVVASFEAAREAVLPGNPKSAVEDRLEEGLRLAFNGKTNLTADDTALLEQTTRFFIHVRDDLHSKLGTPPHPGIGA